MHLQGAQQCLDLIMLLKVFREITLLLFFDSMSSPLEFSTPFAIIHPPLCSRQLDLPEILGVSCFGCLNSYQTANFKSQLLSFNLLPINASWEPADDGSSAWALTIRWSSKFMALIWPSPWLSPLWGSEISNDFPSPSPPPQIPETLPCK